MQFCCLGSGSKGNATLVKKGNTTVMIDCGFAIKHTVSRLDKASFCASDISAVLVTHEHADHISGVAAFSRRFGIPVYATRGTARTNKLLGSAQLHLIDLDQSFQIGELTVNPVAVPHDAIEPCQFVFTAEQKKLGVMTDLGSISAHVHQAFSQCDALLLEANHDVDMLWSGKYPPSLKQRVSSDWGHLSNAQAEEFLRSSELSKLNTLVLGHMSQQNNSLDILKRHFSVFEDQVKQLIYADQDDGFDWVEL